MATSVSAEKPSLHSIMQGMGHEQVVFCSDPQAGLKAIIAIHNTVLGPSMGGVRFWNYSSDEDALHDVLRLSRGMTFKNAIAGLNAGGGKAVIIGDQLSKSELQLRRFGQYLNDLAGKYITAEDVGMGCRDMEYIGMETKFVTGLSELNGGAGDPSPLTAYGVYMGMKAGAKKAFGSDNLQSKSVYVQGVGHVGGQLVKLLAKEGCNIIISDIDERKVREVANSFQVKTVAPDTLDFDMDIYAPCALGATLNHTTIPKLKCKIIAGGANNQLEDENLHALMLQEQGILYAPDFVINSGGITNVYLEYQGNYNKDLAYRHVEGIYDVCLDLLENAERDKITTHQAALKMATDRISAIEKLKTSLTTKD
jgi:leucine dehydrogenase